MLTCLLFSNNMQLMSLASLTHKPRSNPHTPGPTTHMHMCYNSYYEIQYLPHDLSDNDQTFLHIQK